MAKAKVKIVLDSAGIEQLLKSNEMKEEIKDVAVDLKNKISGTYDEDEQWETSHSYRKDRVIYNITTDDEELKWRELAESKIASKVGNASKKS